MTRSVLNVSGASFSIGGTLLLDDASLTLSPGELVVLLGPNGAGKTSLLRVALGLTRPDSGTAMLGGEDAASLRAEARARAVSYLPQMRPLAWPITVRDVVALGRFAYGASPGRLGDADASAVDAAINACDLGALANRATDTLSGGELARVHIARALASQAPLMVADEPVASLDPRHQHGVMRLIRDYVDGGGIGGGIGGGNGGGGGALVVLHDLDLAARYADRLVWMANGRTLADGTVSETMTADRIAQVYDVRADIEHHDGRVRVWVEG